jgi:hypothetical protein
VARGETEAVKLKTESKKQRTVLTLRSKGIYNYSHRSNVGDLVETKWNDIERKV